MPLLMTARFFASDRQDRCLSSLSILDICRANFGKTISANESVFMFLLLRHGFVLAARVSVSVTKTETA